MRRSSTAQSALLHSLCQEAALVWNAGHHESLLSKVYSHPLAIPEGFPKPKELENSCAILMAPRSMRASVSLQVIHVRPAVSVACHITKRVHQGHSIQHGIPLPTLAQGASSSDV